MERRKFVVGLGSLAAGGAAAMGTGAFTTSEVNDREVAVDIAADSQAFVELNALNDQYAEETNDGQLRLLFNSESNVGIFDGDTIGLNSDSTFNFGEVFQVVNTGGWGDLRFVIELNGFDSDVEVELTANGSEANDIGAGTSLLVGDYSDVDNLPKLVQPDACNVDMTITNTKDKAVEDVGGTMTIYAATGGNRDDLVDDTDLTL
jgi:hypothetical protein